MSDEGSGTRPGADDGSGTRAREADVSSSGDSHPPDGAAHDGGTGTVDDPTSERTDDGTDGYGGVFGAFPYAFRQSNSRLLRSYVIVGGLVTGLVVLVFVSALVQLVANTTGTAGGTFTFVRAFYIVLGLFVVAPLLAPVLLVARRHRRTASSLAYDRALAGGGYLFLGSLYLALVVAAPPELREEPPTLVAPVVEFLYGLPPVAAVGPPLFAVCVGYLLHQRYRDP